MSRRAEILAMLTAAVTITLPVSPARAADTQIVGVGTQFLPQVAVVPSGSGVVWSNQEVYRYPVILGYHNIVGDPTVGNLPGNRPFPVVSPMMVPGKGWACPATPEGPKCTGLDGPTVVLKPGRYAYMCGVHQNHMHGILIVN